MTADRPASRSARLGLWRRRREPNVGRLVATGGVVLALGDVAPGRPGRTPPVSEAVLRRQLVAEWAAVQSVMPPDVTNRLDDSDQALRRIQTDARWLQRVAEGRVQDLPADHPYRRRVRARRASGNRGD
jgi:hypothetical protein